VRGVEPLWLEACTAQMRANAGGSWADCARAWDVLASASLDAPRDRDVYLGLAASAWLAAIGLKKSPQAVVGASP
jgi:hypothetical protein